MNVQKNFPIIETTYENIEMMRPLSKYCGVLYCNPNLKSISEKDEKFIAKFKTACKKIPVEFSSQLPTQEQIQTFPTGENARLFVIIDDFMSLAFSSEFVVIFNN